MKREVRRKEEERRRKQAASRSTLKIAHPRHIIYGSYPSSHSLGKTGMERERGDVMKKMERGEKERMRDKEVEGENEG